MEPVIASVLLVIIAAQISTLFNINMRAIASSQALDAADLEIHAAIDKVRNLGTSYNWCSGSGSAVTASCATRLEDNPQSFYSPSASTLEDFIVKCKVVAIYQQPVTDRIVANLSTSLSSLSNSDPKQGVKITSTFEDVRIRRFKISFQRTIQVNGADRTLTRWFYLIPDLASWCP